MKFNVQSKLLLSRLNAVSKVVSSKNAYSILDNFLMEVNQGRLIVTGSDMETRLTAYVDIENVEGEGRFAIDVKRTMNLLKELPDTALQFTITDDLKVTINYVNGVFDLVALNADEFPQKKAMNAEAAVNFMMSPKDVADGIQHTIFALGDDESHPVFMGIYWDIHPDSVTFVASDAHKLVRYRKTEVALGMERSFILPSKPAQAMAAILDRTSEQPVKIIIDDSSATFEMTDFTLSCRFINGRYPNYNSVIPVNNPYTVTVDRLALLNAVRRVSVFAPVGGLVHMSIGKEEIQLVAQDLDHSTQGDETVACEYDGEPMQMGFKCQNVVEVLSSMTSPTVLIKLLDPARAGLFLPSEQAAGEDLIILLMPMMV